MNEDNIYYEFKDLPDKTTPLKAETLNAIQSSIKADIKSLNNKITNINNNIDGISNMVISINRTKADANSVYTKKESDNKYANAIKQELTKAKEAQINSTGANLQNVQFFGESVQEAEPSVDNPSPITSIKGAINYKATGKNKAAANVETRTVSGVTAINNGDGTYTFNGTTTQERSFGFYAKKIGKEINLKKGKTYKLVVKEFSGTKTGGSVTSAVTKETGEMVYNYITQNSPVVTATYNSIVEFINLYVATAGVTFNNYRIGIMLIEQGEDEDFEAYKEKTTTIALPQGVELCGKDNFQDSIDSNGVITKKLRILKFDGTENWIFNNTHNCFSLSMKGEVINKKFFPISNYFVEKAVANLQTEYGMYSRWSGNLFIGFPNTTLEEFKSWLVEKYAEGEPLEILIQSENPLTYELNETEKLKLQILETFEGINNITSNAPISAAYNTDTKSYIDSKFNTLAQQILNIAGGN